MSSMNLDASLDDMIKAAPRKKGGRGGGGGGARQKGGAKKVVPKPRVGGGGGRGAGGVRAKVIAKPRRGPSGGRAVAVAAMDTGAWEHDMFQGGGRGRGVAGRIGGGAPPGGGSAKLVVSNLHYNVSNQDVKASHRAPVHGSTRRSIWAPRRGSRVSR